MVVAGCVVEAAAGAVVVVATTVVVGASVAVVVGAIVVVPVNGAGVVVVGSEAAVVVPETENRKLCVRNTQTPTRNGSSSAQSHATVRFSANDKHAQAFSPHSASRIDSTQNVVE